MFPADLTTKPFQTSPTILKPVMGIISRDTVISSAHIFVLYCFIALVYFVINFTLSCIVRALAKTGGGVEPRPEQ
jgi:putative glutamine transport system permease protein